MIKNQKSVRPKILVLPSNDDEMTNFVNLNREKISMHIVECIEYAIEQSEEMIELFTFSGTQYYVILHDRDYISSLEHIFSYFMENEMYENCQKIQTVKNKILSFHRNIKTDYTK